MRKADLRIELDKEERENSSAWRRQLMATELHERGKQLLARIVAMLVKLCRAMRDD